MNQNVTLSEIQAALALAGLTPTPTSPLTGVRPAGDLAPAVMESLRAKGAWNGSGLLSPEWQNAMATLVDPNIQAVAHIEGVGTARYYVGSGGIASVVPAGADQSRILGGLTVEAILDDINGLLPWRQVSDAAPLRFDLSADELITVVAISDAWREEQLRAAIERRAPNLRRPISREEATRQIVTGVTKPDSRWLVSVVNGFAPAGYTPREEALEPGAGSLIRRAWAAAAEHGLTPAGSMETMSASLANLLSVLVLRVGAPWAEPDITLFIRCVESFWGISFYSDNNGRRATVARLGTRAMESLLRQRLTAFASVLVRDAPPPVNRPPATPKPEPKPAPPPPAGPEVRPPGVDPPKPLVPPSAPQPPKCARCGSVLTKPFCTKCGMAAAKGS